MVSSKPFNWLTPAVDEVALNVDGSSYRNFGGIGGLIRDHEGKWITGFCGHIDFADSLEVELLAILNGLTIALDYGYTKVSCRSDCTFAVSLVSDPRYASIVHKHSGIINEIKELVSRPGLSISFIHTYREANQCADFLAKSGAREANQCAEFLAKLGENDMFYPYIRISGKAPEDLSSMLSNDAMGVLYTRP